MIDDNILDNISKAMVEAIVIGKHEANFLFKKQMA